MSADNTVEEGIAAYRSAIAGDFTASEAFLARGPRPEGSRAPTNYTDAEAVALRAQRWHADGQGALPELGWLEGARGAAPAPRGFAALAGLELARAALLSLDLGVLRDTAELVTELGRDCGLADAEVARSLPTAWLALAAGDADTAAVLGADVAANAAKAGVAGAVLEAGAVRALAAAERGDLETATQLARRASRMARTESFPQHEYLVNAVLARVRRLTGRPHLSLRILTSLWTVAPPQWRPLLAWELAMAGDAAGAAEWLDAPVATRSPSTQALAAHASDAAVALTRFLGAAARGDVIGARASAEAGELLSSGFHPWSEDLHAARLAVLPDEAVAIEEAGSALGAFCSGESAEVPARLHGLCADLGAETPEEACAAWAHARPSAGGRRIVALGAPLALASARLTPKRGRPGRTETTLAALVLAGDAGLTVDALFAAVYGFEYEAAVHANLFKVLLHRARAAVGEAATITREDDRVGLIAREGLLVPDPRCEQALEELVLRALAHSNGGDARSAAEALMLPLRTIQDALKRLREEGAVEVEVHGRRHEYRIEDTTFAEPTQHRVESA